MYGLLEIFLFGMRDQTIGQDTELQQLLLVVEETSDKKSNHTNAYEGFEAILDGEEGTY